MWFYLALTSALVYSFRSVVEKLSLTHINKYILAFGLRAFALPLFLIPFAFNPSLFIPIKDISSQSWMYILFVSLFSAPIETLFFYKALQLSEVTALVPLLSLAPLFTTAFNLLLVNSKPSSAGVLGIILIVASVYLLNISKAKNGIFEPFRHLTGDRASRYIAIMLIFYSLGVIIDKQAITGTNPYFYAFINYVLVSISLFVIAKIKASTYFWQIRHNLSTFSLLGCIVFAYTLPRNLALSTGNPSYVSAILSSSVIISTLLGLIILKEKQAAVKISASLIACAGLIIFKLYA
jgi:transporter family protein